MKRIALFTFALLMAAGLYAQTVKPAQYATVPFDDGGKAGLALSTLRPILPAPPFYKGEAIATNANVIDSFYLYDAAGHLLATCKSHDLDTNTFKGCQLGEGITLDDLLNVFSKELQRLYDKERTKP